jgi:threonine/homoserine/homoserine lactone efflux protein
MLYQQTKYLNPSSDGSLFTASNPKAILTFNAFAMLFQILPYHDPAQLNQYSE